MFFNHMVDVVLQLNLYAGSVLHGVIDMQFKVNGGWVLHPVIFARGVKLF